MTVLKENSIFHPLYVAALENGVHLTVYGDYATGSDGKTYYHVGEDIDGVLQTVGWSCDIKKGDRSFMLICVKMNNPSKASPSF